jgi:hypothetical protein
MGSGRQQGAGSRCYRQAQAVGEAVMVVVAIMADKYGKASAAPVIGVLVLVGVVTWLILEALRRRRR